SQNQQEMFLLIENFIQGISLLSLDDNSCKAYGQKYSELKNQGKLTSEFDLIIGCIALANNAALITKNPKDFVNISGLNVISVY
ncbi:type II toxin-antitoxin system VapC family toxin, partial [Candidatus Woesearchaeota archaeon]|nr:type II toxin-antitoxin system VapC family toxin [Candidatus Woesearchaeota archaeon]